METFLSPENNVGDVRQWQDNVLTPPHGLLVTPPHFENCSACCLKNKSKILWAKSCIFHNMSLAHLIFRPWNNVMRVFMWKACFYVKIQDVGDTSCACLSADLFPAGSEPKCRTPRHDRKGRGFFNVTMFLSHLECTWTPMPQKPCLRAPRCNSGFPKSWKASQNSSECDQSALLVTSGGPANVGLWIWLSTDFVIHGDRTSMGAKALMYSISLWFFK